MNEELIIRYLTGEASAEEERALLAWRAQRPENEQYYLTSKKVFELTNKHYTQTGKPLDINIDQEWNHFVSNISKKKSTIERTLVPDNTTRYWLRVAAAILLLVVSGVVVNYVVEKYSDVKFKTENNTLTLALPDGSAVVLNKNSELSYSQKFGKENRRLTLKGEALFEVKRDEQKHFVIEVNHTEVEVLGTSFNVQGYEDRAAVEVVVQSGVVKFSVPEMKTDVTLVAGQKGIYSKAGRHVSSSENVDVNFLSWNTRKIVFMGDDLRTVVETLNKTYQANIILSTDIPASCMVTVTFDHQSLEAVLNVLKTTLNLTYRINGNQIEIVSAGC